MEPGLSLALNLHANRGAYALLVGSGISRSAGVPTGWEVTLDLVSRLAKLQGHNGDALEWYRSEFTTEPEYSDLLARLARTPAERQALLRAYFEPTDEERAEGLKVPTRAHHAIASLVESQHVRVLISTNFDRLLEQALETKGVRPIVVSNSDTAKGAVPLPHAQCYLLKLHGDYLDTRI